LISILLDYFSLADSLLHSLTQSLCVSHVSQDEESIQLTPEQQRQLAFIESLPFTIEKDMDMDGDQPEERDKMIGRIVLDAPMY